MRGFLAKTHYFRLESRKILFSKNLAGGVSHQALQNLEPLGLMRKILRNKHLARCWEPSFPCLAKTARHGASPIHSAAFAAWRPHDGISGLCRARSDVTTLKVWAVEICWMACLARLCDLADFSKNLWSLVGSVGGAVACGLCPPATAFGGAEWFLYFRSLRGP